MACSCLQQYVRRCCPGREVIVVSVATWPAAGAVMQGTFSCGAVVLACMRTFSSALASSGSISMPHSGRSVPSRGIGLPPDKS